MTTKERIIALLAQFHDPDSVIRCFATRDQELVRWILLKMLLEGEVALDWEGRLYLKDEGGER